MCFPYIALKAVHWGIHPQALSGQHARAVVARTACSVACFVLVMHVAEIATADPGPAIVPDPPSATRPVVVPPSTLAPTWDLDGTYLWLGPVGAASHIDARWDSTFGGEAALVVVRERARLGVLGANLGASRWTARGGGRVWVDGLIGTRLLLGHMMGISLGPILELSELAHPRPGASIGVWGFAGITPFVRLGTVADLGMFAELGVHIALPVLRR
jgi:hypothetical protein